MEHGAPTVHDLIFAVHVEVAGQSAPATPERLEKLRLQPGLAPRLDHGKVPKALSSSRLQRYKFDYTLFTRSLQLQAGAKPELDIAAAALNDDGRILNSVVDQTTPDGNSPSSAQPGYRIEQLLDVPAGTTTLRFAIRDRRSQRLGAVEIALPLSLSGNRVDPR